MSERITLHRCDIATLIEIALEERFEGDWQQLWKQFYAVIDALPRRVALAELAAIAQSFIEIHENVDKLLNNYVNTHKRCFK